VSGTFNDEGESPKAYRTTRLFLTRKNASLNSSSERPKKIDKITTRPWEENAGPTGKYVEAQVRSRSCDEAQFIMMRRTVGPGSEIQLTVLGCKTLHSKDEIHSCD
jgi:hypothetical protein